MKKYGFECEYWVYAMEAIGTPILVPKSIPMDECGYLAEVRGDPHTDALTAAYLMLAEEDRLQSKCAEFVAGKCVLDKAQSARLLSPEFVREALRAFGKGTYPHERGNIYGRDYSPKDKYARAGLHVHFSNSKDINWTAAMPACKECGYKREDKYKVEVPQQQDIPKIIRTLDAAFAKQIKEAKRIPGMYELKPHGFEYRSLPCDISPVAVAKIIIREQL